MGDRATRFWGAVLLAGMDFAVIPVLRPVEVR